MEHQASTAKTPLFFQKALVEEVKKISEGMLFASPGSAELARLSVHAQSLPIPEKKPETQADYQTIDYEDGEEETAVFKCPWCLVKIEGGTIPGIDEMQQVEVAICFGIYNPDLENKGHEELLNLIQKVYTRFACNPLLDRQFTCSGSFEWALQEEDTYPYYFGAIGTSFKIMGYRRELKF